jgi:hypothetical protein
VLDAASSLHAAESRAMNATPHSHGCSGIGMLRSVR